MKPQQWPQVEPLPRFALRCELLSGAHLLRNTRQKLYRNAARSSRACDDRAFVYVDKFDRWQGLFT
jgi:hypothetical protein